MKSLRLWLVLIVVAELLGGGILVARRLLRVEPPQADWSLIDPATAEQIRASAATCESASDWRNLGELYMAAGFFAESEMCHRVACDLAPRNATYRRQWGFALERLGLLDEANTQYQQAIQLSPVEASDCRYFIGRNLLRANKPDEARDSFAKGRTLPANVYELARLHSRAGELEQATTLHVELSNQGPDLLQANLLGYRIAMDREDPQKAFQYADRVNYSPRKLENPFDFEARRIVEATQKLGPGRYWAQGSELIEAGQFELAQSLLEAAAKQDRSASVLELLAELAVRQGQTDVAIELFEELQERHGPFPRIMARIGDALSASQPAKARDYLLKAVQLQAGVDLKAAHHKLADLQTKLGDEAAANRHLALGHYYVGRDMMKYGYFAQAADYFASANRLDPKLVQAWFYLGESKRLTGRAEEAKAAYKTCLELNPHHGRALTALASMDTN